MRICSKCAVAKEATEFYVTRGRPIAECKSCHSERSRKYRESHAEAVKRKNAAWRRTSSGKALMAAAQKRWKAKNPGVANARTKEWRLKNYQRATAKQREIDRRYKTAAYEAYGGFICACCSETMVQFLSIDHVNNDGGNHRKGVPRRNLYKWLKANNYPPGFQILCMNCNFGKARNGGICPHKTSEGSETIPKGSTAKRPEARSPSREGEDIVRSQ